MPKSDNLLKILRPFCYIWSIFMLLYASGGFMLIYHGNARFDMVYVINAIVGSALFVMTYYSKPKKIDKEMNENE